MQRTLLHFVKAKSEQIHLRMETIADTRLEGRSRSACLRAAPAHVRIMTALTPHMDETNFVRWTVKGSELPLRWDDALRRFSSGPHLE